jgi:hypothetical protein
MNTTEELLDVCKTLRAELVGLRRFCATIYGSFEPAPIQGAIAAGEIADVAIAKAERAIKQRSIKVNLTEDQKRELQESWDASPPIALEVMKLGPAWTTEPPQVPGHFWFQRTPDSRPCVVDVQSAGAKRMMVVHGKQTILTDFISGKWAGPIQEPGEPNGTN